MFDRHDDGNDGTTGAMGFERQTSGQFFKYAVPLSQIGYFVPQEGHPSPARGTPPPPKI
jgi:hypothetical protein